MRPCRVCCFLYILGLLKQIPEIIPKELREIERHQRVMLGTFGLPAPREEVS